MASSSWHASKAMSVMQRDASALARLHHPRQHAAHISKALDHARRWIVGMNLIFQVHEAFVLDRAKRLKNLLHRHDADPHRHLALFALEAREVLHMYVKQPRAHLADR